jgi:hypothetical protein
VDAIIKMFKLRQAAEKIRKAAGPAAQLILVLAGLLGICLPGFASDQVFEKTFPLQSGGSFFLENVNGSVQVDGWNRDEVEVRALKIANDDVGDLSAVQIEIENAPGQIKVHTRYPRGEGADAAVQYHVYVPSRILLSNIVTVNGSVVVRGVKGGGDLRSVNGDVEVLGSSGRFSAKTTNGNVRLEISELRDGAPMNVETVNGSVVLALPSRVGANLRVANFNGEFSSELPVTYARAATTARAFRARLGAGGGEISVRTVNGTIHLVREPAV